MLGALLFIWFARARYCVVQLINQSIPIFSNSKAHATAQEQYNRLRRKLHESRRTTTDDAFLLLTLRLNLVSREKREASAKNNNS
jgi:hypothetical protein